MNPWAHPFRDPRMNSLLPKAEGSPGTMQAEAGSSPLHILLELIEIRGTLPLASRYMLATPSETDGGLLCPRKSLIPRSLPQQPFPGTYSPGSRVQWLSSFRRGNPHRWPLFYAPTNG